MAAIVGQKSKGYHWYTEDDGVSMTTDVHYAPGSTHAQVCLTEVDGEGLHRAGIKGYWYRDANNVEQYKDFGEWPNWKAIVGVIPNMTGVTWGLALGAHQEAVARLDILWWG